MGIVIPFPEHRIRRHRTRCELCGHPSSVSTGSSNTACRFCGETQVTYTCSSCENAAVDCPSCTRVLAGMDEIF